MFKKLNVCLVAGAVLVAATASNATLYNDSNSYGFLGVYVDDTHTLTDSFNIAAHGFNPGAEQAIWGEATFLIASGKGQDCFTIDLGSVDGFDAGGINDINIFGINFELAGGTLSGTLLGELNDDGILQYSISATKGHFNVLGADLLVCTEVGGPSTQGGSQVPDGGLTLALLGSGVLGLYALRRRI